jgi:hypothetical protein
MIGAGSACLYIVVYLIDIAAHRSVSDLCHHHALLVNFIISYSAFFFAAALFGLAGVSAATAVVFFEADLFNFALIAFLLLETPNEPLKRFPFAVFLSPLPMN